MTKIYLVQSAGDLEGSNGYANGLLEGGHKSLLVSFMDYTGRHVDMFQGRQPVRKEPGDPITKARRKTLNAKPRLNKKKQP